MPDEPLAPSSFIAFLPEILAALRFHNARKLRVLPLPGGGFEIEVVDTNKLYVSRRELAEMMPRFTATTDTTRYVDKLVGLGMPHVRARGTRIYNVHRVVAWLEENFGAGGTRVR